MNTVLRKMTLICMLALGLVTVSVAHGQSLDIDAIEEDCTRIGNGAFISSDGSSYVECFDGLVLQPIGGGIAQAMDATTKEKLTALYTASNVKTKDFGIRGVTSSIEIDTDKQTKAAPAGWLLLAILLIAIFFEIKKAFREEEAK